MRIFALCISSLVLSSCTGGTTTGSLSDCPPGEAWVEDVCRTVCIAHSDCDEGQVCGSDGVCREGDLPPPAIGSVDGDSLISDAGPGHAAHHIGSGLVVTGRYLDGVTVDLEASEPGQPSYPDLIVRPGGTSSRFEVELPSDLLAGSYRLVVVNAAGSDQTDVTILQGEQGIAGSCSPDACTSQALPGFTDVMSIEARGFNGISGAEQSVRYDGVEAIDTPTDGVWLGVIERASHLPSGDDAFNRSYDASTDGLAALLVTLQSLGEGDLAVLVSRGDLSAAIDVDPGVGSTLATELKVLGASDVIRGLEPHESFALVGHPGIGEGNGAFVVSGTGIAEAVVTVADGSLLGARHLGSLGRDISSLEIVDGTIAGDDLASGVIAARHLGGGAVTGAALAGKAVTSTHIAADAIQTSHIATGAVTSSELASNAVTSSAIAASTITSADIAAGAITSSELASNAVTSSAIAAGTITSADIAANTITSADIAADTITASDVAAGAIRSSEVADNSLTAIDIASNAITSSELSAGAVTNSKLGFGVSTATNVPYYVNWSGTTEHCGGWVGHNFCALTLVQHNNFVTNGTNVWCRIDHDAGQWRVCARGNNTTEALCRMTCF